MFADVVIYGGPKREALAIPAEALIATGTRNSVVLALKTAASSPVDVVSGMWQWWNGRDPRWPEGRRRSGRLGAVPDRLESSLQASFPAHGRVASRGPGNRPAGREARPC